MLLTARRIITSKFFYPKLSSCYPAWIYQKCMLLLICMPYSQIHFIRFIRILSVFIRCLQNNPLTSYLSPNTTGQVLPRLLHNFTAHLNRIFCIFSKCCRVGRPHTDSSITHFPPFFLFCTTYTKKQPLPNLSILLPGKLCLPTRLKRKKLKRKKKK